MVIKLVSVSEMQQVEREANAAGLLYEKMMENAGKGLAEVVAEAYGYLGDDGILGLIGPGNNGGDTLVALSALADEGWPAYAYLVRPRNLDDPLITQFRKLGGVIYDRANDPNHEQLGQLINGNSILLDGILGTGFRLSLKSDIAEVLLFIKEVLSEMQDPPVVVAVDCPSGVDCDNGLAADETLPADLTVTMAAIKRGLLCFPANLLVGELALVSIGLPQLTQALPTWEAITTTVPDAKWVKQVIPTRHPNAHKGTFGTALVIAGSQNYTGAALLAGQAAYRIGAGLVTLAVPASLHPALAGQFPEATWLLLPEIDGFIAREADETITPNLSRASAVLFGPGFGLHKETGEFIRRLLVHKSSYQLGFLNNSDAIPGAQTAALPPLVIDADGLKLLVQNQDWHKLVPENSILTPHPGEMSILTGLSIAEIQANRLEIARHYAREWQQVVILKGAFSVIASPDGQAAVIPIATAALAKAGTGDVLAGLITGLLAQGVPAFPAAVAGAWIHAQAGGRAAEQLGNSASVIAGDVIRGIIDVISSDLA